jgi:hypothetical protein
MNWVDGFFSAFMYVVTILAQLMVVALCALAIIALVLSIKALSRHLKK